MQTKENSELSFIWKKLENNIQVAQFHSASAEGSKVYVKKFEALVIDPEKNITLFLLHDVGQYHGRYLSFIEWSREHYPYITFIAMDFVGHGLSSGTRGHIGNFECLVLDFLFLINRCEKTSEKETWIVVGQGLGGLVALDLANRYQEVVEKKIDGFVISNFILKFSSPFLQFKKNIWLSHTRPLRVLKGQEMLSDPHDILVYEQDPLVCHRPTLITIKEIQEKVTTIYQDSYFLEKPLLLLKSGRDSVINNNGIDYFARGIKKDLLTEKNYSLMKHDLYNEIDKQNVFEDIMTWIKNDEN